MISFVMWLAFFDQHNLINQVEFKAELYKLNQDKDYYQHEIVQIKEDLQELLSDNRKLEKFARERYYMKKTNEEIFVFVDEDAAESSH
ncbi:MAG: septum formation initiator family protein [Flavobacteriales bacterium]|nr:septum formation initiator family protein [Flavobacteriales bacterium]